ncbi:MAG: hypothetical protein R3D66_02390 [Alphaproteobacteria bacterium]
MDSVKARKDKAENSLKALRESVESLESLKALSAEAQALTERAETLRQALDSSESAITQAGESVDSAKDALAVLEVKKSEFDTEINILKSFLEDISQEKNRPILEQIVTDEGFEKALSRALGDALTASLEQDALSFWSETSHTADTLPALPKGATALLPYVKAPACLQNALSQIGVVESEEDGEKRRSALLPGQCLVSKEGTCWRWDGLTVRAAARDPHSQRLEQQRQLKALLKKAPDIESDLAEARTALDKALETQEQARAARRDVQDSLKETDRTLAEKRRLYESKREEQARLESETARLEQNIALAAEDITELETILAEDRRTLEACTQDSAQDKEEELEQIRETLSEARESHRAAVRAFDMHVQQQNTRKARLHAIADERVNLQNRSIRARNHLENLTERETGLSEKLSSLRKRPGSFDKDRAALLDAISTLEAQRNEEAEKLAACEQEVGETGRALREAENIMGEAREARARAQATYATLQEQREALRNSIFEKFEMEPSALPEHAALDMRKDLGDMDSLRRKKDELTREREAMGPVNLRADDEAQTLEKEASTLIHERTDLLQAIEELRGAIQTINKEARERLLAAFDHVNAHFQSLFIRLFGGGQAHLALIDSPDSKDPLGAGLEIFAQPPGKSLQSLSLLSGGEQTLASIALIFAMFLTNPSPICVLDEIDAPLDDANVDRVCDLLEEIAERGETRFLVISHHRLTMARMDRLYGVTMAERGVSQLVSVDLQKSFEFLEEAA